MERPTTMRTHAGQIAFPGGAADPGDVDLADTALREATEETGVDRSGIEVLGLAAAGARRGQRVRRDRGGRLVGPAQPGAARSIRGRWPRCWSFRCRVLVDPANRARVHHPSGYTGPAFEVDDHLIWGLTAHLLDGVLDLAGWQQPWDHEPADRHSRPVT